MSSNSTLTFVPPTVLRVPFFPVQNVSPPTQDFSIEFRVRNLCCSRDLDSSRTASPAEIGFLRRLSLPAEMVNDEDLLPLSSSPFDFDLSSLDRFSVWAAPALAFVPSPFRIRLPNPRCREANVPSVHGSWGAEGIHLLLPKFRKQFVEALA